MAARRKPAPAPPVAPLVVAPPAPLAARPVVGLPCPPEQAAPLRVVAEVVGPIVTVPRLDAMLAALEALRSGLPAMFDPAECADIEIPVVRSPCGRFHLCADPAYDEEHYETRHRNRRFPMAEAQMFAAPSLTRVNVQGGPTKSFRVPYQRFHVTGRKITWLCLGDAARIEGLLACTGYLGRQRGTGHGKVARWRVEPVTDVWPGFPILRNGAPLRVLPADHPGVTCGSRTFDTLTYPYWDKSRRQPCLVA